MKQTARPFTFSNRAAALLLLAVAVVYGLAAFRVARADSLWMDEVLAVWGARSPDLPAVWSALIHGSEFSPPAFPALLHGLVRAGLHSNLAMRLPSILATPLAAMAVALLVRRRSSWPVATLAAAFLLVSPISFGFAVQARPYACALAVAAWALWAWDGLPDREPLAWRAILIGALLSIAQALHFYSVLLIAGFAVAELGWSIAQRHVRWPVLAAIGAAGASILAWRPIMRSAAAFSQAETWAPEFYGRPTPSALIADYVALFSPGIVLVPLLGGLWIFFRQERLRSDAQPDTDPKLLAAAVLLTAYPAVVFLFALTISHSFVIRYTLPGVIGFALMLALVVDRFRNRKDLVALVLLAALLLVSLGSRAGIEQNPMRRDALAVLAAAPGDLPIATGNGARYLEALEALPPHVTARMIFLSVPDTLSTDPTNQHEVERWSAIRPGALHLRDAADFLCSTGPFLLFVDDSMHDDIPAWLKTRGVRVSWLGKGYARLALVSGRTCASGR